jgi:hypothetical protein
MLLFSSDNFVAGVEETGNVSIFIDKEEGAEADAVTLSELDNLELVVVFSPVMFAMVIGGTGGKIPPHCVTAATKLSEENNSIEEKNNSGHVENSEGSNRENMGKALMQLYGMGQGMNSFPTGVTQANPFLHPTMFSATGK